MKIIIFGGTGFIGLNIAKKLLDNPNCIVTLVDNNFRGKKDKYLENLLSNKRCNFIECDLTKESEIKNLGKNFDKAYLLASIVGVEYTNKFPEKILEINSKIILNVMDWLVDTNVKNVLFTSTSEVYAGAIESKLAKIPTGEDVPVVIEDVFSKRFTYAITKLFGESYIMHKCESLKINAKIIRYHNVYGPRMGFKHVIPQVIKRFKEGERPFKIYGENHTRSFNYVDDAVDATIKIMDEAKTGLYHIGNDEEITIRELVEYIGELYGYDGSYIAGDSHDESVSRRSPDISKLKSHLSIKPKVSWKDGVKHTFEWYIDYFTNDGDVFE